MLVIKLLKKLKWKTGKILNCTFLLMRSLANNPWYVKENLWILQAIRKQMDYSSKQ